MDCKHKFGMHISLASSIEGHTLERKVQAIKYDIQHLRLHTTLRNHNPLYIFTQCLLVVPAMEFRWHDYMLIVIHEMPQDQFSYCIISRFRKL